MVMKRAVQTVLCCCLLSVPAFPLDRASAAAPVYSWIRTGPGGGGAFSTIGAGPARAGGAPGIILALSDLSGVYRSLDGGQSWDVIGSFRGLTATHGSAVGFHPTDPAKLFVGTDEGIFRSIDSGLTWSNVLSAGYVTDIRFAPADPNIGYSAVHSGYSRNDGAVYRTEDTGLTWNRVSGSRLDGHHILKLEPDPLAAEVVFALTGKGRGAGACGPAAVFVSGDGGVHWDKVTTDLPGLGQVMDMALDPADSNVLYVTTYGADVWEEGYEGCIRQDPAGGNLYRYTWVEDHWQRLLLASRTGLIWVDRTRPGTLRLIDVQNQYPWNEANGVWETVNSGADWRQVSSSASWSRGWSGIEQTYGASYNGDAKTLGFDLSDPDAALWVDSQFVYRSTDRGRSFSQVVTREVSPGRFRSRGVDNIVMFDLAYSADGATIYAALADLGCFRSSDGGAGWQSCNDGRYTGWWQEFGGNAMTVAVDPADADRVWITTSQDIEETAHTLLQSTDRGETWQQVHAWPAGMVPSGLSVDPGSSESNRTLYITVDGDVWQGNSDGSDWHNIFPDCNGCRHTAVRRYGDDLYLFAGGEAGLFRSVNGGSWEDVGGAAMRGDPEGPFYDNGWQGVAAIVPDPVIADRIYVTVYGEDGGLFRSDERGNSASFHRLKSDPFMRDVAVSPADPGILLATSSSSLYHGGYQAASGGVWYTATGGEGDNAWQQVNNGLAWPFAGPVAMNPADPGTVILGSPGAGFYLGTFDPAPDDSLVSLVGVLQILVGGPARESRPPDVDGDGRTGPAEAVHQFRLASGR